MLQDLALILEQIPGYWSKEGEKSSHPASSGRPDIQTFVFSATLTLPASLRKRLHKGGCLESKSPQQDVDSVAGRWQMSLLQHANCTCNQTSALTTCGPLLDANWQSTGLSTRLLGLLPPAFRKAADPSSLACQNWLLCLLCCDVTRT